MNRVVIIVVLLAVVGMSFWVLGDRGAGSQDTISAAADVTASDPAPRVSEPIEAPPAEPLQIEPADAERVATPTRRSQPRPPAFLVVNAVTGERITHGTVLLSNLSQQQQESNLRDRTYLPPKPYTKRLIDNGPFGDSLKLGPRQHVIWIGAEGYAWAPYVRAGRKPGEPVELEPAGDLTLRLSGPAGACGEDVTDVADGEVDVTLSRGLRAFNPEGSARAFRTKATSTMSFETLAAGHYDLAIHSTHGAVATGRGPLLYETSLAVTTGTVTDIPVSWVEPPSGILEIVVICPTGSELPSDTRLDVRDATTRAIVVHESGRESWAHDGHVWRRTLRCVSSGSRLVKVHSIAMSRRVEILAGETTTVTFDASSAARVTVAMPTCLDNRNMPSLLWGDASDTDAAYNTYAIGDDTTSVWVPPQPMWFQAVGRVASSERLVVSPQPGQDLEIELTCSAKWACQAIVHFIASPSLHPREGNFMKHVTAEPIGHHGGRRSASYATHTDDSGFTEYVLLFSEPGRYALTYPSSWNTFQTIEIEAGPGEREPIEVKLE